MRADLSRNGSARLWASVTVVGLGLALAVGCVASPAPAPGVQSPAATVGTTAAPSSTAPPTTTAPTSTAAPTCPPLGPVTTTGTIGDPAVDESSGLAVGVRSPGVLYTHNDSGETGRFFAMTTTLGDVARFDLAYHDGYGHDAESLLVDSVSGDLFIVTKAVSGTSQVFRFHPGATGGSLTPTAAGTMAVPAGGNLNATGGSVSSDGSVVAVRTYDRLLRFRRPAGRTVADALAGIPCVDTFAVQPQGESVAIAPGGRTLYVTSEGRGSAIQSYALG